MNPRNYFSLIVRFFVAVLAMMVAVQSVEAADPAFNKQSSLPTLLQQMEGSWTVSQKMWPGKNQPAVQLPAATARRRAQRRHSPAHPTFRSIRPPVDSNTSRSIPGCRK